MAWVSTHFLNQCWSIFNWTLWIPMPLSRNMAWHSHCDITKKTVQLLPSCVVTSFWCNHDVIVMLFGICWFILKQVFKTELNVLMYNVTWIKSGVGRGTLLWENIESNQTPRERWSLESNMWASQEALNKWNPSCIHLELKNSLTRLCLFL